MRFGRRAGTLAVVGLLTWCATASAAPAPPWDPFFAARATVADLGADTRPYGVASGDYDSDGDLDLVVGRTTGHVALVRGNGDGTFAAPVVQPWKQTTHNAWALAAGDVNSDGRLDVVWGANTASNGCSIPGAGCTVTAQVLDGEVRAWLGNGDGTFHEDPYFVSGVRHNKGLLLADVGTDAGSVDVVDVDADGDQDVVAGVSDATNSTAVKLLRNAGSGAMTTETVLSQPTTTSGDGASPTYFPATTLTTSPWGLAFGDADADGDNDLFVGDRALYVYLFVNDGTGAFTLRPGNIPQITARPNVYLRHDPTFRAEVGFTPSLAAGDLDGDGRADVAVGLHSGIQAANTRAHDGEIVVNLSRGGRHELFGSVADVGNNARGLQIDDVNGDGVRDVVAGELGGKVSLLRQLAPRDEDGDGISDYVDNAPQDANAPRLDMDTDGALTFRDQLDNDGDTVLGDPEDETTWQRLGDPADSDDDGDGEADGTDVCPFVADAGQEDADDDGRGDACDPLDDRDTDDDGVPDGPMPGDPLYDASRAASAKWSTGDTHFVIRIDALGRFFQNEFTGLMTDAAISSPATWAAKCQGMYTPVTDPDPGCADLPGGKEVAISTVVIPRLLWTDPEVVDWINDRNDNPLLEIGQHGTYHAANTMLGDWKDLADRNFFSCELCGFNVAESFQLLDVGRDTLLGDYSNRHLRAGGATDTSPKVDWATSANPLISYAPPFNASDAPSRDATAQLGFRSFSASVHEEETASLGQYFSPEGSHHERFDQFGMYHASADLELEPPETVGGMYDPAEYDAYLRSQTEDGGLTTWLIEEVEWSGRPCNELDRLDDLCNGESNRENNTVYRPRWDGWMQLLDYVRSYPGGVVMTLGEVALAKGYDNAPTAANADQADADHDGVGDAIDGAVIEAAAGSLVRNAEGTLSATLRNGGGDPIAGQRVDFTFDTDGDGTGEAFAGTTGADGVASVQVTATRPVGAAAFRVDWDGGRGVTAGDDGDVAVRDVTSMALDAGNPDSGQVTDPVTVGAVLTDSDGAPLAGRTVEFSISGASESATTDGNGRATATLTLVGPAGAETLRADFAGAGDHGESAATAAFTVLHEDTTLTLAAPVIVKRSSTVSASLLEADGAPVAGRTIAFEAEVRRKGTTSLEPIGTAVTGADGVATIDLLARHRNAALAARFDGDGSFLGSASG